MRQKLRLTAYQWAVRLPKFRGAGYFQEALRGLLFPRLAAHVDYGLRIEIDPWEWAQIDILKNGHTEPETLRLFGKILRPGDVYYDVGAHIGFHALVARHFVGPMGQRIGQARSGQRRSIRRRSKWVVPLRAGEVREANRPWRFARFRLTASRSQSTAATVPSGSVPR